MEEGASSFHESVHFSTFTRPDLQYEVILPKITDHVSGKRTYYISPGAHHPRSNALPAPHFHRGQLQHGRAPDTVSG